MSLLSSHHSSEATPEQQAAAKERLYNAYKTGDLSGLIGRGGFFKNLLARRLISEGATSYIKDSVKQEYAQNALKLSGQELWDYAGKMNDVVNSVDEKWQQMYNNAVQSKSRRSLFKKFGGDNSGKLGD